jgi:hypothetical protein
MKSASSDQAVKGGVGGEREEMSARIPGSKLLRVIGA